MGEFAKELRLLRQSLGHKSAKSFFQWLKKSGVSFNYSYYMRLEQGGLPSGGLVKEIAQTVKGEWEDRLVLSYCRSLFPNKAYLFPEDSSTRVKSATESVEPEPIKSMGKPNTKELNLKQIAAIAQHEYVYHLFLLVTLSRRPIPVDELRQWFSVKALELAVKALEQVDVIKQSKGGIESIAKEARFPEAYSADLKASYERFDKWDESFGSQLGLEMVINKMQLRRVSGRYISIIQKQLDVLFELVRSSDEMDTRFNDKILQLKVVLKQGSLPG